jgi:hypothetical protein
MLHPQIVVHEFDGQLAEQLRPLATTEKWTLREQRQADPLWRTLVNGGPTVLVVRIESKDEERVLALIESVNWHLPDVAIVAVGGPDDAGMLSSLTWDVGAAFAMFPPLSRDHLPDVVAGLMRRTISEAIPATAVHAESPP